MDFLPELSRIRHPVRIFASDQDKVVPSVLSAQRMAQAMPQAHVERLENAGHVMLPFEGERWRERLSDVQREIDT